MKGLNVVLYLYIIFVAEDAVPKAAEAMPIGRGEL